MRRPLLVVFVCSALFGTPLVRAADTLTPSETRVLTFVDTFIREKVPAKSHDALREWAKRQITRAARDEKNYCLLLPTRPDNTMLCGWNNSMVGFNVSKSTARGFGLDPLSVSSIVQMGPRDASVSEERPLHVDDAVVDAPSLTAGGQVKLAIAYRSAAAGDRKYAVRCSLLGKRKDDARQTVKAELVFPLTVSGESKAVFSGTLPKSVDEAGPLLAIIDIVDSSAASPRSASNAIGILLRD